MPSIALSLINVTKRYGATAILDGLSFGLFQNEKVGLIGRNGAGKSTLFRLLTGDEMSLTELTDEELGQLVRLGAEGRRDHL